jgi:hypothetical protein
VGLTSPGLPYLLALLAFIVLLAIILGWPWLSRRSAGRIGLRLVSLCVLQALVLGLIFVIVNNEGEFYSSWSDLLGTDASGHASIIAAGPVDAASHDLLSVTGRTPIRLPAGRAGGALDQVRIAGQLSGISIPASVYLPAAYFARGSRRDYPVLAVISDAAPGGGSPYAAGRLARSAATEIAGGRMGPLVIVMLPATVDRVDQACLNLPPTFARRTPQRPAIQAETFFAQDFPAAIESAFRVSSSPANWALLGDQAGGYCAYTQPPGPAAQLPGPFRQQDNLVWQLGHLPVPPVTVLFAGPGSATGPGLARPFIASAQQPMRVSAIELDSGNWPLAHVLTWVAAAVGAPAPAGQPGAAR